MIEVQHLSKHFKIKKRKPGILGSIVSLVHSEVEYLKAVDDISFSIKPGELVGYIGQNGAGKSIIVQREVHYDTYSFSAALRSSLREDPDVVLIGEMRDLETIASAITIAETGHLVFATLHTNSAAQSIDRMVDVFPPHQQQSYELHRS